MTAPKQATCPECRRRVKPFRWHGRVLFEHHMPVATRGNGVGAERIPEWCSGSGWLVEDEDYSAAVIETDSSEGAQK